MAPNSARGARSATGRRQHGLSWLPWLALFLLIVLAIGAYLLIREIGDDDDIDSAPVLVTAVETTAPADLPTV